MKFKIKHEKSNLIFMTSVILFCLITCVFWIMLREYRYFTIYFILTLLISHIYYFTCYFLEKDYLLFRLGLFNFKIKYKNIKRIEKVKNSIKLYLKYISINIYPNNIDMFYAEINNRMKGI